MEIQHERSEFFTRLTTPMKFIGVARLTKLRFSEYKCALVKNETF